MDQNVMLWLAHHRAGSLSWVADRAMDLGRLATPVCVLLALGLFLLAGTRAAGIAIGLAGAAATVSTDVLKLLIGRPRPPHYLATVSADGYSFPSSAAATSIAVVIAAVVLLAWPRPHWRAPAVVLGVAVVSVVGWAVMYLGAHWLTDVLAGWMLGGVIAAAACRFATPAADLATRMLAVARHPSRED